MNATIRSLFALALIGCADSAKDDTDDTDTTETDTTDTTDTTTADEARLRVVHLSPDAPAVSIWADGVGKLADDLAYGESSDWLDVPAGTYDIRIRVAGAVESDAVVYSVEGLTLAAGDDLSAIAAGSLASSDAASSFRVIASFEDFAGTDGGIRARVIHASPDAPAVDLDVGNDDPAAPEISGFARFADSGADGVALPAGSPLPIGIALGGARVTAFTAPPLPADSTWTIIAAGFLGDLPRESSGFALFALGEDGQPVRIAQDPTVHVVHASPDAPAVDLFVGGAQIADNLSYGAMGAVQVSPGAYDIDIFAHAMGDTRPAGAPAYTVSGLQVDAGERYLALATGFLGSAAAADSFRVLPFVEGFDTAETDPQVNFIHGSPNTPAVDVGPVERGNLSAALFSDVSFGEEFGTTAVVPAATYTLGAAAAGTTPSLLSFTVPLGDGVRAWAIAAGDFPGLELFIVDTGVWPWAFASVAPNGT